VRGWGIGRLGDCVKDEGRGFLFCIVIFVFFYN
jgi:hypothetical protein